MPVPNMPHHRPVWAVALLDDLAARGIEARPVLEQAALDPSRRLDPEARIPFGKIAAVFEAAAEVSGDDLLGFRFGTRCDPRDAGLIAFVGFNSPVLRDGLRNTATYARVMGDAVAFDLKRLDSDGIFSWAYDVPAAIPTRHYAEWYAATTIVALRHITDSRLAPRAVHFAHPRRGPVAEMERYFGCPVIFGAAAHAILLRPEDLDRPIVRADRKLLRLLVRIARDTIRSLPPTGVALRPLVERAILVRLSGGTARAATIAADLGMSERTLSRRLAAEGLTFGAILREMRMELATRYLRESDLSLSEIAFLLGYGGLSALTHAYRRDCGLTPGAVRRAAAAAAAPPPQAVSAQNDPATPEAVADPQS